MLIFKIWHRSNEAKYLLHHWSYIYILQCQPADISQAPPHQKAWETDVSPESGNDSFHQDSLRKTSSVIRIQILSNVGIKKKKKLKIRHFHSYHTSPSPSASTISAFINPLDLVFQVPAQHRRCHRHQISSHLWACLRWLMWLRLWRHWWPSQGRLR